MPSGRSSSIACRPAATTSWSRRLVSSPARRRLWSSPPGRTPGNRGPGAGGFPKFVAVAAAMPRDSLEQARVRRRGPRRRRGVGRHRRRVAAPQGRHRQRRRRPRPAEPRHERAHRWPAHLRRLSEPDGPAGVSRRLLGGRARRGRQGPVRCPLPGQHGRPRQHRHETPARGLAGVAVAVRRLVRLRQPVRHAVVRRGPHGHAGRLLVPPVGRLHRRPGRVVHGDGQLQADDGRRRGVPRLDGVGTGRVAAGGRRPGRGQLHAADGRPDALPVPADGRGLRQRR